MKKFLLLTFLLALVCFACAETFYVEKDTYREPPLGDDRTYTISDTSIIRLSTYGKFRGMKLGSTQIAAVKGDETVLLDAEVVPKITGIALAGKELTLLRGESAAIDVTVKPASSAKALLYESSDASVASVDADGTLHAVSAGICKIKVFSAEKSATLTVKVILPVESVSFSRDVYSVDLQKSLELSLVFAPAGAEDRVLSWESSDPALVSVKNGKITAKKAGDVTVTAQLENGMTAQCTVRAVVPVKKVALKKTKIKVGANKTFSLEASVSPDSATDKALTYVSSNPGIASVDENGVITGVSKGNCRITVSSANGKTAVADVTVTWTGVKSIQNLSVRCSPTVGETYRINAQVLPEDASVTAILYESSAPDIASVDENGVITAHSEGEAVITMTSADGGYFSACKVTVRAPGGMRLEGAVIGLNPGHQVKKNLKKAPIAPGSKTMSALNNGCAVGVKTKKYEYTLNLEVALLLRDLLENAGATVVMTRTEDDVEIDNIERAELLNAAGSDLAIQIHANNNDKSSLRGISTYSRVSGELADSSYAASVLVHDALLASTGAKDAGIIQTNGYMSLNYSETPAILIEMGFMSNPEEDVLMSTPEYQMKLAQGMFDGICAYLGR